MVSIKAKIKGFEGIFLEAVDEGLYSALGENPTMAIYYHFEKKQLLNREDIPYKPEVFADALDKILRVKAAVIETSIVKNLYKKLELNHGGMEDKNFWSCIEYAKRRMNGGNKV